MNVKLISILVILLSSGFSCLSNASIEVIDLAGRTISFQKVPQRIILGESRYLFALSILNQQEPLRGIVGMLADLKQIDAGSYRQYQEKFPSIDRIARVGHSSADSFSLEKVLSLKADLAIFGVDGHGPNSQHTQLIEQLQRAGVKVIFVDFRNDPIVNTSKSIHLLGRVLGREQQAKAFTEFYQEQLQRVLNGLAQLGLQEPRPNVFLHSRVGLQDLCCETMVRGMMAAFLQQVEGTNIAAERVPGFAGVLNLEYLFTQQPEVYIATAIGGPEALLDDKKNSPPYIVLGAGVTKDKAQESFVRALKRSHVSELKAIQSKQAYAIWHHFYNTPLNIVAVQVFATWLYPDTFAELNPRSTLEVLFERFQSVPLDGTYWLTLDQAGGLL